MTDPTGRSRPKAVHEAMTEAVEFADPDSEHYVEQILAHLTAQGYMIVTADFIDRLMGMTARKDAP